MKTAVELIAAERTRQLGAEGYSYKYDDSHTNGELANFACCYALDPMGGDATNIIKTLKPFGWELKINCNENTSESWGSIQRRIKDLVKAGALLSAEIERLQRLSNSQFCDGDGK
jgi:hypothetical protein